MRLPFGNNPMGEQRYLCILTDGKETAGPLLSTLGTAEFPDTVVFAMGFGEGGGWDGVDYTTITTLTSKGKPAPSGVQQTFHGESADVINKFFTNSIAHILGYEPTIDPRFELFAGEHVMVPFVATASDQSFMIIAQGYDYTDKNWSFHLRGPDGATYDESTDTPIGLTVVRARARLSAFLNRDGASQAAWVGNWHLVATYKAGPERFMLMSSLWQMTMPSGTLPLLGPKFARLGARKFAPLRTFAATAQMKQPFPQPSSSGETDDACTLDVHIFSRPLVQASVVTRTKRAVAGQPIEVRVNLRDLGEGTLKSAEVLGRLIAPDFSIGNAVADTKTLSATVRKKLVLTTGPRTGAIDVPKYLAAYEAKKPAFFGMRDEEIAFDATGKGTFRARVPRTPVPGVYRMGISVMGTIERPDGRLEQIVRILNTEVALGILPSAEHSRPTLWWLTPTKMLIRFTPQDALGNIPIADPRSSIQVWNRRRQLAVEHRIAKDGTHEVEVELLAGKVHKSGTRLSGGLRWVSPDATVFVYTEKEETGDVYLRTWTKDEGFSGRLLNSYAPVSVAGILEDGTTLVWANPDATARWERPVLLLAPTGAVVRRWELSDQVREMMTISGAVTTIDERNQRLTSLGDGVLQTGSL